MSVREGFEILEEKKIFSKPNILLFKSKPAGEELISKIHTREMIERVKRSSYYETALYSVGGVVQATEKVLKGEIKNALVYIGVGGHHAGRNHYWGGCFFNPTAIAVEYARENGLGRKFAIIDTDTHHADGTREIFLEDDDVLHICYCGWYYDYEDPGKGGKTKICLSHSRSDEDFIRRVSEEIPPRVREFQPDMIYWICGLDTHRDSYGTRMLTEKCYPEICKIIKGIADDVCDGKLVVKTGCNAPAAVSRYVNLELVRILGEL
ncbi:MAG: arginase family protein [Candidatus Syntropharchaeia archaeon]